MSDQCYADSMMNPAPLKLSTAHRHGPQTTAIVHHVQWTVDFSSYFYLTFS